MGLIKSIHKIMSKPDGDVSEASPLSGVSSNNLTFIEACARTAKLTAQSVLAKMVSAVSPVGVHRFTTVTCSQGQYSAPPHAPLPLPNGINVNNINNYNISYRFWMYVNPDDKSMTELAPFNGTGGKLLYFYKQKGWNSIFCAKRILNTNRTACMGGSYCNRKVNQSFY